MPVYSNLKCIFVHIPKTGGQSINKMLNEADQTHYLDGNIELPHMTIAMLKEYLQFQTFYKFTIIRHPVDRMISEYCFSQAGYRPYLPRFDLTFHEYVREIMKINTSSLAHKDADHIYPQHHFVDSSIDYIGKFEDLPGVVKHISHVLKIQLPPLPHINQSNRQGVICEPRTRRLIKQLYKEDYIRFGFARQ